MMKLKESRYLGTLLAMRLDGPRYSYSMEYAISKFELSQIIAPSHCSQKIEKTILALSVNQKCILNPSKLLVIQSVLKSKLYEISTATPQSAPPLARNTVSGAVSSAGKLRNDVAVWNKPSATIS